jgi:hypothetical protein
LKLLSDEFSQSTEASRFDARCSLGIFQIIALRYFFDFVAKVQGVHQYLSAPLTRLVHEVLQPLDLFSLK